MNRSKFFSKLTLALLGAFLAAEFLTRFVFQPSQPVVRLSFKSWFAQKKQAIGDLPQFFSRTKPPKLPPPIVIDRQRTPSQPPTPAPRPTPVPTLPPTLPTPSPKPIGSPSPPGSTPPPDSSPTPTPTPPPSSPPTPTPPPTSEVIIELIRIINQERSQHQLNQLTAPSLLMQAAQIYVDDLGRAGSCSHGGAGNGYIWDYAARLGYQGIPICEVIACGADNPRHAVDLWLDSPGHRACLLEASAGTLGAGVWNNNYWLVGIFK